MAIVKCPPGVTSVTFVDNVVLNVDADNNITCSVLYANAITYPPSRPVVANTDIPTGAVLLWMPGLYGILKNFVASGTSYQLLPGDIMSAYRNGAKSTLVVQFGFQLVQG